MKVIHITFDYSAASSHPFRFSTTSDGTHNSGTEYTTGVSVDSNITTIVVASGAPNLFYYCTNHSGMGGTALTPARVLLNMKDRFGITKQQENFRSIVAVEHGQVRSFNQKRRSLWNRNNNWLLVVLMGCSSICWRLS